MPRQWQQLETTGETNTKQPNEYDLYAHQTLDRRSGLQEWTPKRSGPPK
jgi:hypothetical protein